MPPEREFRHLLEVRKMSGGAIFDLVAEYSRSTPASVAILARGRPNLTYGRLHDHVRHIASQLNGLGVRRNQRVAIVLPNGPEMATACLATAACATCAPLNPDYKAGEFEFYMSDLKAGLLLTQSSLNSPAASVARAMGIQVVELDTSPSLAAGLFSLKGVTATGETDEPDWAHHGDVALVLHTSGTTSRPKIVPLTQCNIRASANNIASSLSLGPDDIGLNIMPQFHIGGLVDLLAAPLSAGGSVVCATRFTVPDFTGYLNEFKPTWCQAVPTMILEIVNHIKTGPGRLPVDLKLRFMRAAAAAMPQQLAADFERLFKIPVIEIYGMTETTGLITGNPLPPGRRVHGSAGLPAGPDVGIMDEAGNLLPAGQSGEVVVRGETVMAGYEDIGGTNTGTFHGQWLRTGDFGYQDRDNYLFLTGRIKEMINRGGEKISPGEVDDVLASHPAVEQAAAFPVPHKSLGEDVAAAVVLKKGKSLEKQELIAFSAERLAYFKVPRTIFFVDSIPRTPNGKVKRNLLAETLHPEEADAVTRRAGFVVPTTPVATAIAGMWAAVLSISDVGMDDNFFDLGGDSLKAATLVNEIQKKWGETVFVAALFDAPTVRNFETFVVRNHPQLAAQITGQLLTPAEAAPRGRIDSATIRKFAKSIGSTSAGLNPPECRNPQAVFILSPPRSGSTLLRAMLAGNNRLFAPPELYLLPFDNLVDRKAWFSGSQKFQMEGAIRCLMQLKDIDATQAQALMSDLETKTTPTLELYRMIQDLAGDRILVDKTPYYAAQAATLQRMETCFRDALYVHLVRHPYGMIRSFEEMKMEQLWYPRLVGETTARSIPCPFSSSELGELIWVVINRNILNFLKSVPEHRQYRVRFEDIVGSPRESTEALCRFLRVDFDPQMLKPQDDKHKRMTDGIHAVSRMIGDAKFHKHKDISAGAADLWKKQYTVDFLGDEAWTLAHMLGYAETVAKERGRQEFEI
ncbi:MAG: AMP-binding protein [bacterium]